MRTQLMIVVCLVQLLGCAESHGPAKPGQALASYQGCQYQASPDCARPSHLSLGEVFR